MRSMIGIASLLVALAIVGLLVKKQLSATKAAVPAVTPATGQPALTGTVREQSLQVQQQVKQQMEGLMQQARPMPEDDAK